MNGVARILFLLSFFFLSITPLAAQSGIPFRLPDTGQTGSYTATPGEDVDVTINAPAYRNNQDGTITDAITGLMWQQTDGGEMTWEEALIYSRTVTLADQTDWRLPNIKELQSLNHAALSKPSVDKKYFTGILSGNNWSSTTQQNAPARAWDLQTDYGIVSYHDKTMKEYVLLVRDGFDSSGNKFEGMEVLEAHIPGGEFMMGDHFGFVDPSHPSDEVPLHSVMVGSVYMAKTETTNRQYLAFLNAVFSSGEIEIRDNTVFKAGSSDLFCFTHEYAAFYSISFNGSAFTIADFRANHPMVGVMWTGAAAFCNWLSKQKGLSECYDPETWSCDFTQTGYRLPTEAEWEYAGRGGQLNPYFIYPNGNSVERNKANLPDSADPYEIGAFPHTTPAGFYDGGLKERSAFKWPGSAESYQTGDGANGFGLYDMQGNVWEFVNDWYGQKYYSVSPYDNPQGPDSGFIMPDGKPYRSMRGGNWYNGLVTNGINDGHSRVANRNPSYYRGPQDPNHPWYHIGFRVARKADDGRTGAPSVRTAIPIGMDLQQNYPNPFNPATTIAFILPKTGYTTLKVYNSCGQWISTLVEGILEIGIYAIQWNASGLAGGIYYSRLEQEGHVAVKSMTLVK